MSILRLNAITKKITPKKNKDNVYSNLCERLNLILNHKLLAILGTNEDNIKNSTFNRLYNCDINNLAEIIKDARNDMAHFLEKNVDYAKAIKYLYVLQLMIYYMVFEKINLANEIIKKIILSHSIYNRWLFGIDNNNL
jgi:hypothetical protein